MLTAEGFFFTANSEELRNLAKEWIKDNSRRMFCGSSSHCHRCLCCSLHRFQESESEHWCSCPLNKPFFCGFQLWQMYSPLPLL
ncbi:hypothetical protein D5086_021277 [Populus alba]|uniref:Uncharacterized protein n=1 Tax=Populus alba TaxID=43335 RepID=A0ACC4BD71_POPAL